MFSSPRCQILPVILRCSPAGRASKDAGPAVATPGPSTLRGSLRSHLRVTGRGCSPAALFPDILSMNKRQANPGEEHHAKISSGQLQDLPVGAARGDRAAREEHRVRVPPYRPGQSSRLVPRHLAAQEGAGAEHRRQGVAVRVERDQRIPRRDHRAAAASGRSGAARGQPGVDRLSADLLRNGDGAGLLRGRSRVQGRHRANPAGVRAARRRAGEAGRRAVLQRRKIFAGRCRLRAVPAALSFPRPHQAARRDREIPAGEGLGGNAAQAAFDAFIPGSRASSRSTG